TTKQATELAEMAATAALATGAEKRCQVEQIQVTDSFAATVLMMSGNESSTRLGRKSFGRRCLQTSLSSSPSITISSETSPRITVGILDGNEEIPVVLYICQCL